MALDIGTRVGSYEVLSVLGAGGMGEVYRARDTRLQRDVALKILPDVFANDPERLARFQREAQLLASLNHTTLAGIYGLEESGTAKALILELVDGQTLAERIAMGPVPVAEALLIAKQIADALGSAHDAGIIHRDLKPANIKMRPDGAVKVLDFGLAKAVAPDSSSIAVAGLSQSPTITNIPGTMMGVILGTAAYMSPEQAKGRIVDKRADVWAFGCVLYEMLTGKRSFEGEDVSDTIAAILRAEPDWSALPDDLSPQLKKYLQRCLHRDLRQRVHDISDVRLAIEGAFDVAADRSSRRPSPNAVLCRGPSRSHCLSRLSRRSAFGK